MIPLLFLYPVITSVILFFIKSKTLNIAVLFGYSVLHLICSVWLFVSPSGYSVYFKADSLNILFLILLAVVFFGVSIYNIQFSRNSQEIPQRHTRYTICFLLFICSMTGAILSTNIGLFWVFIEATTLTSAPLIFFDRTKSSLEAAWKYIFICSIGISLAFVGIILISMGSTSLNSLFFADLYNNSAKLNPFWLKLAFPFILIGFGTKMGLAPVHAWLPDAHSEAPSPVSAMLSGALLNCAMLGIIRIYKLMETSGLIFYGKTLLLVMGFTSMLVSAVYIIKIKNYKRMLAYSSIENMGIISIAISIGGAGLFAAMLHIFAHSLAKAAFFLTSGNIIHRFKTKEIDNVHGLLANDKVTAWIWVLCFLCITGFPPFPMFLSKFFIIKEMYSSGNFIVLALFILFLTVIMAGMSVAVFKMFFSVEHHHHKQIPEKSIFDLCGYLPQCVFILILLVTGIYMPGLINRLILYSSKF